MKLLWALTVAVIVASGTYVAMYTFSTLSGDGVVSTDLPTRTPEEVVSALYALWFASANPMEERPDRGGQLVSASFVSFLDALYAGNDAPDDPLFCTSTRPQAVTTELVDSDFDRAVVTAILTYPNQVTRVPVEVARIDGTWQVSDVVCREAQPVQDSDEPQ